MKTELSENAKNALRALRGILKDMVLVCDEAMKGEAQAIDTVLSEYAHHTHRFTDIGTAAEEFAATLEFEEQERRYQEAEAAEREQQEAIMLRHEKGEKL